MFQVKHFPEFVDYCKGVEKSALVRLCGVLGVLTENNDLATAALLAATRIERLEKKIPVLNVDLAEASMHAYNGESARMKLETELARRDEIITRLKEDGERLFSGLKDFDGTRGWKICKFCHAEMEFVDHASDCPITLHRALMKEVK